MASALLQTRMDDPCHRLPPLLAPEVTNFLDISDPGTFPRAFIDGTIGGDYAPQHTSDLVRFPLLLKYGGVYADVGMMQIGDLDCLWHETVSDPASRFEVLSYNIGGVEARSLMNYFLACGRNNPFFERGHRLLLELWAAGGGKTRTEEMHSSPLLKGVPLIWDSFTIEEEGGTIGPEEVSRILADYVVQAQAIDLSTKRTVGTAQNTSRSTYNIEHLMGSQLIDDVTGWDEKKAFKLISLSLPKEGEMEGKEQKQAKEIVEACLQKSFGCKLAHGLILRMFGETLGSLWRKHVGSDDVPGTYARMRIG